MRAAVLYFLDPSEQCGYTLESQKSLFDSIKPLFNNKPLLVVANKTDVLKRSELSSAKESVLAAIEKESELEIMNMSTVTEDGVMDVKTKSCEILLQHRVDLKYKTKKVETIMNRLTVAVPEARDNKARPAFITNIKGIAELLVVSPDGSRYAVGLHRRVDIYNLENAAVEYSIDLKVIIISLLSVTKLQIPYLD